MADAKPVPSKRGRKPGTGKGSIREDSSGGFRCRININCKQMFGPTRRTRAEAESDLRVATDPSITVEERLLALRSPRAHKPPVVAPRDPSPETETAEARALSASEIVHCLDAPTSGAGLSRCGSDQSRPLLVTGITSKVNCIGCLRLLVDDRVSGLAKTAAVRPVPTVTTR